jgi:hypothetical protein
LLLPQPGAVSELGDTGPDAFAEAVRHRFPGEVSGDERAEALVDGQTVVAMPAGSDMRIEVRRFLLSELPVQVEVNEPLYIVTEHQALLSQK